MQAFKNIAIIVTSSYQIDNFLSNHILALAENNKLSIISNSVSSNALVKEHPNINNFFVPFIRNPSPFKDLSCLLKVVMILRSQKIDIYYSMSPKAGLIAALSGFIARVKRRVNFFTGQVWVTRTGFWKFILKSLDRLIGFLITHAIVDSNSQRQFLIDCGVLNSKKPSVIGSGSVCGVAVQRFVFSQEAKTEIRNQYQISEDEIVILFLGRLTLDKGIFDLLDAFYLLKQKFSNIRLLFTGPDDGYAEELQSRIKDLGLESSIVITGATTQPENYFSAANIFCLPSYREGFGQVALEASCLGLPTVGYDIYGLSDAIINNSTGFLCEKGNINDLSEALEKLILDPVLRKNMGDAAQQRVLESFTTKIVIKNFIEFHETNIAANI